MPSLTRLELTVKKATIIAHAQGTKVSILFFSLEKCLAFYKKNHPFLKKVLSFSKHEKNVPYISGF